MALLNQCSRSMMKINKFKLNPDKTKLLFSRNYTCLRIGCHMSGSVLLIRYSVVNKVLAKPGSAAVDGIAITS